MDEVRDPIQLRCVGFCGADDTVDPAELKAISEQHGWVEWGVLFRPEKAGSPRFASDEWLKRLGQGRRWGRCGWTLRLWKDIPKPAPPSEKR